CPRIFCPRCFPCWRVSLPSAFRFGGSFQRQIHQVECLMCFPGNKLHYQRREQTGKMLALDEADAFDAVRHDEKRLFAIEDTFDQPPAAPTQFRGRDNLDDEWRKFIFTTVLKG